MVGRWYDMHRGGDRDFILTGGAVFQGVGVVVVDEVDGAIDRNWM